MNDFISQIQCDDYNVDAQDWADYNDYLDSIGYDNGDDDWDEDPDENYSFQNLDSDFAF